MSTNPSSPTASDREQKLENYRTCKLCADDVSGGLDGMIDHMDAEHTMEELSKEASFPWSPDEPLVFHHPNGTVHFVEMFGSGIMTTVCGRDFSRGEFDLSSEEWTDLQNYEHADADDYCGSCENQHRHKFCGENLPAPLESE